MNVPTWIIPARVPFDRQWPRCAVLTNPTTNTPCGNPATTGRTILELPICDGCFEAVGHLPERNLLVPQ